MRLVRLSGTSGDLDEGIRGIQLLLMSAGYRPMQEIYSSQGPLLLDLLYPWYVLFGETLGAAQADAGFLRRDLDIRADIASFAEFRRIRLHKRHADEIGDMFDQVGL